MVSDGTGVKTHERKTESGLPVSGCRPPLYPLFKPYGARDNGTLGAQSTGEDTNLHEQGFSMPDHTARRDFDFSPVLFGVPSERDAARGGERIFI